MMTTGTMGFIPTEDGEKMKIVFQNLLNNAIKYSPSHKKIFIGVKKSKKEFIFFVKDKGSGIPKEQQSKIFQKFFRAKNQ